MGRTWRTLVVLVSVGALAACASAPPRTPAPSPEVSPEIDRNDPLAATLLMQQGQALINQAKFTEGLAKLQEALKLQPNNPTIHNLMGRAGLAAARGERQLPLKLPNLLDRDSLLSFFRFDHM